MILDQLADYSIKRVNEAREIRPFQEMKKEAESLPRGDFRFEKTLKQEGLSIIAKISKGKNNIFMCSHVDSFIAENGAK